MGQPLGVGSNPVQALNTNPSSVRAIVTSQFVIARVASRTGLSARRIRSGTSVTAVQGYLSKLGQTPLIQITAFSEDSTENTYDALRPMIELGRLADVLPKTGEEFIRLPGGGRIDTVTSSNQSRLGQRATFITQDEVGIWTHQNKMAKLADVQWRNLAGMGGRSPC